MQGVGDVEAGDVDVSGGRGGQGVLLVSKMAGVVSATLGQRSGSGNAPGGFAGFATPGKGIPICVFLGGAGG